jgi:hypothetical protein
MKRDRKRERGEYLQEVLPPVCSIRITPPLPLVAKDDPPLLPLPSYPLMRLMLMLLLLPLMVEDLQYHELVYLLLEGDKEGQE